MPGARCGGPGPRRSRCSTPLFYVASAGSFDKLIDTEGGAQQDRLDGGAQLLPLGLAESLGDRVRLGAPVRRISHDDAGVRVVADGLEVEADRVIVAVPPAIAARIEIDPLPPGRPQLAERLRPGALTKCMALYEEPFWRADGLSGESVTDAGPVTLTFDSSPRDGSSRGPAWLRRRSRGASSWPRCRRPSAAPRPRLLRAALRPARRAAFRLRRTGLERGGVVRRRADLELRPGWLDGLRPGPARAGRPRPLGRHRDRHRVERIHGGRPSGRRACRRRGLA